MRLDLKPADTDPADAPRQALVKRLRGLRDSLHDLFAERSSLRGLARARARDKLLLGLEVLCKLEEQVLLPALQPAAAGSGVAQALREIEWLRDLTAVARQSPPKPQDVLMAVIDGLASEHFVHVDRLLAAARSGDAAALQDERWQHEVRDHGGIEDEERDPVGLPPR